MGENGSLEELVTLLAGTCLSWVNVRPATSKFANHVGVCSTHMLAMPKPSERSMFRERPRIDNNRHRCSGCANAHTMRRNVGQRIAGARRLAATKRHRYVPLAPAIKTRRGRRELANAPKKKRFVEREQNQADEQTRKELGATSMGVWQY